MFLNYSMASAVRASVILIIIMLRILTRNVQGFKNSDKQGEVMHFARDNFVDLVFLEEVNIFSIEDSTMFQQNFIIPSYFSLAPNHCCGVGV